MATSRVRPMVEGGILSGVAILFALISVYIPIIGAFINLIWPVPIILLGVRHGYKWSLMATAVAGILIALLIHPLHAVSVAVGFGLTGIVLGHCFRRKYRPVTSVLIGSVASLVSKLIVLGISAAVLGINPLADQSAAMSKAIEQAISVYRSFGMKETDLAQITENMRGMLELMKLILPAGLALASVVDTYLNFLVSRSVLRKLGHHIDPFPAFSRWSLYPVVLYVFIVSVLMLYWGKSRDITWLADAGLNLQVASSMLLMLQGLSMIFFYSLKYQVPKFIRWMLVVFVLSNGFITQMVVFAGAFDIAMDFRKLRRPASPSDSGNTDPGE